MHRSLLFVDDVVTRIFNLPSHIMKRCFQPGMAAVVLTTAMLQAFVPASAAVIQHTDGGTYNYPPETTDPGDSVDAYNTRRSMF